MKQNSGLPFTHDRCAKLSSNSVVSGGSPFFKIDLAVLSSTPDHRESRLLSSTTRTVGSTIDVDTETLGLFLQKLAGKVPAVWSSRYIK